MTETANKKEWYVVNTYAGHENRVKDNLEKRLETMGISENLFRIVVAEETQIEVKNEKSKEVVKNIFPGYLFVEMIMTDEAWYVVRNTPGVTGFIGSSGGGAKPFPVKQDEIEKIGFVINEDYKGKHKPIEWNRENILAQLEEDVEFGFQKALDMRGISSSLMFETVLRWNRVLEEGLEDYDSENYAMYGLPLFKATAVKYGWNNPIGDDNGDEKKYGDDYDE